MNAAGADRIGFFGVGVDLAEREDEGVEPLDVPQGGPKLSILRGPRCVGDEQQDVAVLGPGHVAAGDGRETPRQGIGGTFFGDHQIAADGHEVIGWEKQGAVSQCGLVDLLDARPGPCSPRARHDVRGNLPDRRQERSVLPVLRTVPGGLHVEHVEQMREVLSGQLHAVQLPSSLSRRVQDQ